MNGDNSLHNSIYILLNLELRTFPTMLLQGNVIIWYKINLRKLKFLCSVISLSPLTEIFTTLNFHCNVIMHPNSKSNNNIDLLKNFVLSHTIALRLVFFA